jgi:hypothetical protein
MNAVDMPKRRLAGGLPDSPIGISASSPPFRDDGRIGQCGVGSRQRTRRVPSARNERLSRGVEQHQVRDVLGFPHALERRGDGGKIAAAQMSLHRRREQVLLLREMELHAGGELRIHDAYAARDQEREHRHLHERAAEQQPRAQGKRNRWNVHGLPNAIARRRLCAAPGFEDVTTA